MRSIDEATAGRESNLGTARPGSDAGRRSGFDELYERRFSEMVHLATFLTGEPADAPDLVHDAFVRVHEAWPRVREPDAYLRRAVVNACSNHRRGRARWRVALTRQQHLPEQPPAASPDDLTDLLVLLPRRQAAALVLRFYLDLPDQEIAAPLRAETVCRLPGGGDLGVVATTSLTPNVGFGGSAVGKNGGALRVGGASGWVLVTLDDPRVAAFRGSNVQGSVDETSALPFGSAKVAVLHLPFDPNGAGVTVIPGQSPSSLAEMVYLPVAAEAIDAGGNVIQSRDGMEFGGRARPEAVRPPPPTG